MKLEVREIASAMVGSREPMVDFKADSEGRVMSLAQPITLRDVLAEMCLSDDSDASPGRTGGAAVNAPSTVVALALPVKGPILKRAG